jgi:hypothetical protein
VKAGTTAAFILITKEKPSLLAFHISMVFTTRVNCMLYPVISPTPGRRHRFAESENAGRLT